MSQRSMMSERPLTSELSSAFTDAQLNPLTFLLDTLTEVELEAPLLPGGRYLTAQLELLNSTTPLLNESGIFVQENERPSIELVELPFTYAQRIKQWQQDAMTFEDQACRTENSWRAQLTEHLGGELLRAAHTFPGVIDFCIQWGAFTRSASKTNISVPGDLQTIEDSHIKSCLGVYTWAPTAETAATATPEFFHRTFMIDQCFDTSARSSKTRRNSVQFQARFFERSASAFEKESEQLKNRKIEKILIDVRDRSVAFLTPVAAYVCSAEHEHRLFVVYRPPVKAGELKTHHMPGVFDESQMLVVKSRQVWPQLPTIINQVPAAARDTTHKLIAPSALSPRKAACPSLTQSLEVLHRESNAEHQSLGRFDADLATESDGNQVEIIEEVAGQISPDTGYETPDDWEDAYDSE